MYKYTNDMLPSVMHELYKKNNEIYVNSYSNISARLWNALKPKLNTNVSLP